MGLIRVFWNVIPMFFALAGLVFTIMVLISGTNANNDLANIYFMRINTTDIIPSSVPEAGVANSIAQSIGLHDFYQNSLWGYCEGYNENSTRVTYCSKPTPMYVFNPVTIFNTELLKGQNVTVPQSIQNNLDRLTTASHWMFALYIVAACLLFITCIIGFTALCFFVGSVVSTLVALLALIFTFAASMLATIMFTIYRNAINNTITTLNVSATLGTTMFALTWTAVVCGLLAFLGFLPGLCCGHDKPRRSRRQKYGY